MGQIADDMISGFQCSWCGTMFEREHGFPVVCKDCGEDETDQELNKLGLQRATIKEMGGEF